MASKPPPRGRPETPAEQQVTRRHVLNLTPKVDAAVVAYQEANGISRPTEAMRQLLTKALKAEGML